MENLKKLWSFLLTLPPPLRGVILALVAVIMIIVAVTSCGQTRAVARTYDKGVTTITISTNNPTSVDASPNVDVQLNPKNN